MNTGLVRCGRGWLCATGLLACLATGALAARAAEVTATPDTLTFTSLDATQTVRLEADGQPVLASGIGAIRLLIDAHDYKEMFSFAKADGEVTLKPTAGLEVGSYDLVIETESGEARVKVYTPLTEMPDTLEEQAASLDLSLDQMQERLGFKWAAARVIVTIELPIIYYEGHVLDIAMPENAAREFAWLIDGEVLDRGMGKNRFTYVFAKPGPHVLSYVERQEGAVIAAASASTMVVRRPPFAWDAKVGVEEPFVGPWGFTEYEWFVDGEPAAKEQRFNHTFAKPGEYKVECLARKPDAAPPGEFTRFTLAVTVAKP